MMYHWSMFICSREKNIVKSIGCFINVLNTEEFISMQKVSSETVFIKVFEISYPALFIGKFPLI